MRLRSTNKTRYDELPIRLEPCGVRIHRNRLILFGLLPILFVVITQSGCVGLTSAGSPYGRNSTSSTGTDSPLTITTQPISQTVAVGQTATFSVTASGTAPLSYQWRKNGTAISGATSATYTTPVTTTSDDGSQFTAVVSNAAGNATSNAATLTVTAAAVPPSIATQPASQTVTVGQTTTFSVTASGTAPLSYQWRKNGTAISGATSVTYTTPVTATSDNGSQFTAVVSNAAGNATSNAATLTVTAAAVPPSIATQPASQTVTVGQTTTFSVTASGTAPLSYQWRKNGTAISGATSAIYTTPVTATSDDGSQFTAVVSNAAGNATSNAATLTVTAAAVPPSIATQPASQTVTVGQTTTFSVTASGTAPLSYQWRKNGTAISGATSATYTTPVTTTSDNGSQFTAVVSNAAGNATSNAATLTVTAAAVPPSIATQPASQTVTVGQTTTFSVTASGTAPLSYQWRKNGTAISGATSVTYTTPVTATSDNGSQFAVAVSNSIGTVTSSTTTLTVKAAGQLAANTTNLSYGNVSVGSNSILTVTLTNVGGSSISIANVTLSGAGVSVNGVSSGLILAAGGSAVLNVTFAPFAAGNLNGTVTITSNATNPTVTISLLGTAVQPGSHLVTLGLSANSSSSAGFNIYRSSVSGGPYTKLNSSLITVAMYTDSNVSAGQTYFYVGTSIGSQGTKSSYSNEVSVTIPTP